MKTKIAIASRTSTFETRDLESEAKRLGVDLEVYDVDSLENISTLAQKDILYWRGSSITKKYPKQVGRSTMLRIASGYMPVVNRNVLDTPHFVNKSVQQAHFSNNASDIKKVLPMKTFLAASSDEFAALIERGDLQFPVIAKPNLGMRGERIILVRKLEDIQEIESELSEYVFQEFIENTGDYRIFVVGGVAHDVILRRASAESTQSYLNNVSQGGEAVRVEDFETRKILTKAGTAIASLFNFSICGVDILHGKDGNLYFMEINSVPQWGGLSSVSPYSTAEHIIKTLDSIVASKKNFSIGGVRDHYLDKLQYLPTNLQFHFLSRIHLWSNKQRYGEEIRAVREAWWETVPEIEKRIAAVPTSVPSDFLPSEKAYRKDAIQKHHKVQLYNIIFFKLLFDQTIFDGKRYEELIKGVNQEDVMEVREALLQDCEAVFTLATPAINFLYFCEHFFPELDTKLDPGEFLAIADSQSLENAVNDRNSRIYLYTHVIIGASRFYSHSIDDEYRTVYLEMLQRLEQLIQDGFTSTSLDHKVEFLVCCRLCNHKSDLEQQIYNEVVHSVSEHGMFVVNTYNTFASSKAKQTMEAMEHTNVLTLMAFLDQDSI